MNQTKRPLNIHKAFHAHVYFDASTLEFASALCAEAGELFDVKVGRVHQKPVGPHPHWSCQIAFNSRQFDQLIPWLDTARKGLTVLVHGLSGDDLKDHTEHAYWLGDAAELNIEMFQ